MHMLRAAFVLISIFLCLSVSAQDTTATHGTIKIRKKYTEADHWPRIAAKFDGKITPAELCHPKGIYTIYPMRILSFELKSSYIKDSALVSSNSNQLTDEMCKIVTALPEGAILHFENIMAVDSQGKTVRLNSLRYVLHKTPIKDK